MITIEQESRYRSKLALEIDNFSPRYITENKLFTFTSPSFWTLDKNFYFLLRNSREIEFDKRYFMRPDFLSYDMYGTVILDKMLMYMNGVPSIEDFDLVTVIIPDKQAVMEICKDKFPQKKIDDLEGVDI